MGNKKTALIVEGGGQRGVFSFGITDTFINRNYDPFDIYIGVSNGVAVLCWYLIRETDNNLDKMLYAAKGDYLSYKNIFTGKDILKFHQMYDDGERMFKPSMETIKNNLKGFSVNGNSVIVSAGENWDDVVSKSLKKNLYGLENLSGIPGSVGASPIQNIGAYLSLIHI